MSLERGIWLSGKHLHILALAPAQNQPSWCCRRPFGCSSCVFAFPPWQWQLLARLGAGVSPAQGLHQELAAGRPVPASLSNCRDNCHKSNCSCWITSILHHHPQLPRASSQLLFQGWKVAPLSQERLNQAGSGHLKQSPRTEPPLTAVPVCKCALGQGADQELFPRGSLDMRACKCGIFSVGMKHSQIPRESGLQRCFSHPDTTLSLWDAEGWKCTCTVMDMHTHGCACTWMHTSMQACTSM